MVDHHIGGASQSGQGPKNNILQQILNKIQEQLIKIEALKHFQPAQQLLDKIQEQSLKIKNLENAQKTPTIIRNPSPNPAIHIKLEGLAESRKLYNPPKNKRPFRIRRNLPGTAGTLSGGILKYYINLRPIRILLGRKKHNLITFIPN